MRRNVCAVALGLGLFALVGTSPVQAFTSERVDAQVPFAFQIGDLTLPAGEYAIKQVSPSNPRLLVIRSADGVRSAFFYADEVSSESNASRAELVFDRQGERVFLRGLSVPGVGSAKIDAPSEEAGAVRKLVSR